MLRNTGGLAATLSGGRAGFQNENPPSVPLGSTVTAQPLNDIQENICAVIEGTGGTLSNTNDATNGNDQLLLAIARLAAANTDSVTGGTTTLNSNDAGMIFADATSSNATLVLPAASSLGGSIAGGALTVAFSTRFTVARVDNSANSLTIQPSGSDRLICNGTVGNVTVPPYATCDLFSDDVSTWIARILPEQQGVPNWAEWLVHGTYSFAVPPGRSVMRATLTGSGGGGTKASGDAGVGGAGAEEAVWLIPVAFGQTLTIVVGQGGAGGVGGASPTSGGNGTTTSIYNGSTLLCEITGGAGGLASNGTGIVTTPNTPGAAISGSGVSLAGVKFGTQGGYGINLGGSILNAAGGAPLGIGLAQVFTTAPGQPSAPGHGGWGGVYAGGVGNGGAGADGYVRLEW